MVMIFIGLGYNLPPDTIIWFRRFYKDALIILAIVGLIDFILNNPQLNKLTRLTKIDFYFHLFTAIFISLYFLIGENGLRTTCWGRWLIHIQITKYLLFLLAFSQLSGTVLRYLNSKFMPARMFGLSFLFFILIGSLLLSLPNCLQHPISYVDALFTATSAVCITGLTVVNIGNTFTDTGQLILLFLIQIGGLGVLSFTTLFGILAVGKTSLKADQLIKDMLDQNNFNEIFKLLRLIFLTTFVIEFVGAIVLYQTVGNSEQMTIRQAIFHSISAFCNAGFTTYPDGLNTPYLQQNNTFLLAISIIVIIGSIGFPVINNLRYGAFLFGKRISKQFGFKSHYIHQVNIFSINTKMAVFMTVLLLVIGSVFFFFSERDGLMAGKTLSDKLTLSFFMSMTPRSGGFNCYNMGEMTQIVVLFSIMLMWIGGGPLSTGGGIKTTTFGLSVMSIWSIMRGRDYVEVFHRRINSASILRASALVFISVVLSAISIILISIFDPQIPLRNVLFEVLSAISTCGLSMDTTPLLSDSSLYVLMILMFCGRVGLLAILESLVRNEVAKDYQYPTDYVAVG